MEPRLIDADQMTLVGLSFFGDPFRFHGGWTEENEIGRLWSRFIAYLDQQQPTIRHLVEHNVMYEVHIEHAETQQTGEFEVFVGLEVECLEETPVELVVKFLPPTTYAVFALRGPEIASDWNQMMSDWISQSGYRRAYTYGFQRYDERFKGTENLQESVLEAYVPVKRGARD
jgi:AraC family transcriptional regulator